jgi:hypothetical protein
MKIPRVFVYALLLATPGPTIAAQSATDCGTTEEVLQHYRNALGGEAAIAQVHSLLIRAASAEPHTFNEASTAHSRYRLEWQAPNRIRVNRQYLLSPATIIFDGSDWSLYNGRVSHNEDSTPAWRRKLMSLPYNDYPENQEFRMMANPLLLVGVQQLYRRLELSTGGPGECVLQAWGTSEWGRERRDYLAFRVDTGLLRSWQIQAGRPGHETYMEFLFDDYRPTGSITIPYSVYFDFYRAAFRVTSVIVNPSLSESDFVPKP